MAQYFDIDIKGFESFQCRDDKTVFRAMCEKRVQPVHHGCCGGGCGVCKMKIVSGKYEVVSRMSRAHISADDETSDIVLLCCVQPRSNLTIEIIS